MLDGGPALVETEHATEEITVTNISRQWDSSSCSSKKIVNTSF